MNQFTAPSHPTYWLICAQVWVHAAAFNLHVVVWCSFILCWLGDPGVIKGTTAEVELTKAYDAYFDRLVTGERDDDAVRAARPFLPHLAVEIKTLSRQ